MNDTMKVYTYEEIDRAIATLDQTTEAHTLLPALPEERLARLVEVSRAIRPLLSTLATGPFFPLAWRTALMLLVTAMDELLGDDVPASFKAGRDLEE